MEKILGGHLNIGGAQSGYFRNFGRFYGFFIAISEIIGGARAPPAPPVTTPLVIGMLQSHHISQFQALGIGVRRSHRKQGK